MKVIDLSEGAVGLDNLAVDHGPEPLDVWRRIRELAESVRGAVVDADLEGHVLHQGHFASDLIHSLSNDFVGASCDGAGGESGVLHHEFGKEWILLNQPQVKRADHSLPESGSTAWRTVVN